MPFTQPRAIYGVHPSLQMARSVIEKMKVKTGRSLEEWCAVACAEGPAIPAERTAWLKTAHGLGTNYANFICDESFGLNREWHDDGSYLEAAANFVELQYQGKKADLRPLFEAILDLIEQHFQDVKACPCQTMVPIYRSHVIAQIKPTTITRIYLGFALKDTPVSGRLIDTGGFAKKDRITHRIPISQPSDIDDEIVTWLRVAYQLDDQG